MNAQIELFLFSPPPPLPSSVPGWLKWRPELGLVIV